MSLYGEDGSTGYAKENLYEVMKEFLEGHSLSELMEILSDVIESTQR